MLGKISFVDKARFNKGVSLDTIHQIAVLAVKFGAKIDAAELSEAVRKAGFEPVRYYLWKGGKLQSIPLK